ncbi:ABC transporter permease [Chryseolinea soli]|nr:ABC transporter permease [Chryseolinea soli]
MKHTPPALAKRLLQWFCHAEFIEEIEGDLYELFQQRIEKEGLFKARLHYYRDVLDATNLYRSQPRKKSQNQTLPLRDRWKHFFTIAIRNMTRSRSSTAINLCGLAVSLASFLFIALYIVDETTYDTFHPDAANTYRISYSFKSFDGREGKDSRAAGLWSVTLKEMMPEVKHVTRFSRFGWPGNVWTGSPDNVFVEQGFFWVDSTFTDIFSLPLASIGNAREVLRNPQEVILSETTARRYFGDKDPIGQSITYVRDGMSFAFTVGAVMKDFPSNAHFKPDFIANCVALNPLWKRNDEDRINSWMDSFSYSFINVEPGTDLEKVSKTLQQIFDQNLGEFAKTTHPILIPLHDVHFTTGFLFELDAPGDKTHLYIFGSIGLLILAMACINYMNLATARSIRRSKEVGLRKTLGVSKAMLITQFLGESFLMTGIAMVLAMILFAVFLSTFNMLTLKNFDLLVVGQNKTLYLLLVLFVTVGILAGSYPAFYLSGFRPVEVLKGTLVTGRGPENFRKGLVILQICITLVLLTSTYVIQSQLSFIDHTRLSEHKDEVVTVRLGQNAPDKMAAYKQIAKQDPHVKEVSTGPHLPRRETFGNLQHSMKFSALSQTIYSWDQLDGDFDFSNLFGLELVAGRSLSADNPADSSAILLNEKAVKELGTTPEKALGLEAEVVTFFEKQGQMERLVTRHKVIGVVKDFNFASVRLPIAPVVISAKSTVSEMMYVKLDGGNIPEVIQHLVKAWKQVYPATPFQYWFMDEEFGRLYQTERQMGQIFTYLAAVAILIACLGLFGLASFTAEQKVKEIGIRKVMGASTAQILLLLTSRYIKLAAISFLIGIPIAFISIHFWMETFVYKATLGLGFYIVICILILAIVLATVGLESLRAARANPSDSMRHE